MKDRTRRVEIRMKAISNEVDKETLRRWMEEARGLIVKKASEKGKSIEVYLGVLRDEG